MKAVLSLVDCTQEVPPMQDEPYIDQPPRPVIDASHVLSALFILLLAGVFTVGWNTSREVLVIGKDVSFMREKVTEAKSARTLESREVRGLISSESDELRAEIARLERHFNTAWARIRAMEQKMNMPVDRDEYKQ